MQVYDQATKAVPNNEKLSVYEIYIARAAEIFGVPKTREIYEKEIESGLPDKDVKTVCLKKYAELEKSLGEIDRAVEYMFLPLNLQIHDLIWNFGISGMSLRFSMEMKIPSEKCFVLSRVCLQATARHILYCLSI